MDTFAYLMLQPQHELVKNINQIIITIKFLQLYTVLSNGIHSYIYLLHWPMETNFKKWMRKNNNVGLLNVSFLLDFFSIESCLVWFQPILSEYSDLLQILHFFGLFTRRHSLMVCFHKHCCKKGRKMKTNFCIPSTPAFK